MFFKSHLVGGKAVSLLASDAHLYQAAALRGSFPGVNFGKTSETFEGMKGGMKDDDKRGRIKQRTDRC